MRQRKNYYWDYIKNPYKWVRKKQHNWRIDNIRIWKSSGPGGSGWGGRWEGGSGWGRHVNRRPFHFNVWQNSLQIKFKKKRKKKSSGLISMWKDSSALLMIREKKLKQKWASISHSSIWMNFKLCVCVCMNVLVLVSVSTGL